MNDSENSFPFSLREAAQAVGDPPLPDQVSELYHLAFTRMEILRDSARRSVFELIAIAFGMELFRQSVLKDVTIGPFQVQDLSVFQKTLPLLAAYLLYDLVYIALRLTQANTFLRQINALHRQGLETSNFRSIAYPSMPSLLGNISPWLQAEGKAGKLGKLFGSGLSLARILSPWILIGVWYQGLFDRFGFSDPIVWISLVLAMCFLGYAIVLLYSAFQKGVFLLRLGSNSGRQT